MISKKLINEIKRQMHIKPLEVDKDQYLSSLCKFVTKEVVRVLKKQNTDYNLPS